VLAESFTCFDHVTIYGISERGIRSPTDMLHAHLHRSKVERGARWLSRQHSHSNG